MCCCWFWRCCTFHSFPSESFYCSSKRLYFKLCVKMLHASVSVIVSTFLFMTLTFFFSFKKPWTGPAVVSHFGYLSKGVYWSSYWREGKMGVILEGLKMGKSLDLAYLLCMLWSSLTLRYITVPLIVLGPEPFLILCLPFLSQR